MRNDLATGKRALEAGYISRWHFYSAQHLDFDVVQSYLRHLFGT